MWPTLYTQKTSFGEVPYNSWGLMITLGFLFAAIVAHRRAAKVGIDPDKMVGLYVVAIVAGLAGARLLHFLMATPKQFFADPLAFFNLGKGGFAFYGGFILAGVLGVLYGRWRGMNVWKLCDVVGPTVMLGLAFGRVGCFLAGCCHGEAFTLPPDAHGILPDTFRGGQLFVFSEFPFLGEMTRHGVGENDVPVYPTQLYEHWASLAIFGVTSWMFHKWRKFDGQVFAAVLILYSIWRPFNESLRGDDIRGTDWFGLTTSQVVAIPVLVLGVVIVALRFDKGVAPEKPFEHPAEEEGTDTAGSAPRL
ncbi:MAG: prolipoprotein diacylglyceryl transferase [Myxococcota bacterium]